MMKRVWKKLAAFALSAAMLVGSVAAAAQVTPDGHVLREPERMEGIDFPDGWSEDALRFCVSNGILEGDGESLAEKDNATRAELAAMLVSVLQLREQADLSGFTDVSSDDWFHDPMAAAVAAGIISGTSATTLSPNAPITREQAVTMLRKAFALNTDWFKRWTEFSDSSAISAYARSAVSALAARGFVTGFPDGSFRPQQSLTREEIAQIFYALFTCISDDADQLTGSGRILYRGSRLPDVTAVDGNLTVCSGSIHGGSVSGVLALRGRDVSVNGCRVDEISLAAGSNLSGNVYPEKLFVTGGNSVVEPGANHLYVYGAAELNGSAENVYVMGDGVVLNADAGIVNAYADAELNGSCDRLICEADGVEIRTAAKLPKLQVRGDSRIDGDVGTAWTAADTEITGSCDRIVCQTDGVTTVIAGQTGQVEMEGSGSFRGNADTVYLSGDSVLNGSYDTIICREPGIHVTLTGHAKRINIPVDNVTITGDGSADYVDVPGKNFHISISCGEIEDHVVTPDEEAASIETIIIWDVTTRDTNLYSDSGLSNRIRSLPQGTRLEHYYLREGDSAASVYTEDGVFGYVPADAIRIPTDCDIREEPYSDAAMEYYVNSKGLSSPTNSLVWVNLKTQTANVFTGSKGNWKLQRSFSCSTGANTTPTVRGTFQVIEKLWEWNFGDYYVKNVTRFYEGYAFHSITYYPDGRVKDGTIGRPSSHGCVRMLLDDCGYIHDNVPVNSTIHVY